MQGADPASLAIGTQVSAKYKGAYCEAKVKSVDKQIKVRVTLKNPNGTTGPSLTIRDHDIISIISDAPLQTNVVVKLKHPDNNEQVEATVKQIQDQSRYTVIFNDGDIATLKRNALCMKSGKHFNASESLDNLPLTHPEHFSSPASNAGAKQRRRHKSGHNEDDNSDEEDTSTDDEGGHEEDLVNDPYTSNIGRVVWAENTDKKTKAKDAWFLALIVAPTVTDSKIRTKKEFLIRSFKDGRYYTVSKKDTQKFRHNESPVKAKNDNNKEAMERAITFLERRELPPHWDRDILQSHEEESTNNSTTASSESEELDDDDEEEESPEEKDHLVAELYKHMEDRGSPIDKTPSIDGKDIELYRLYKIVQKLGGHARVSNKNLWRQVAGKLGFFSTWGSNQVRVHYKRYLQSFEEFNRTLGCTMVNYPKGTPVLSSSRNRQISGSSRVQMRGSSRVKASLEDSSSKTEEPEESTEPIVETSTVQADLKKEVESPPAAKKTGKKSKREISAESARKKQMEELKMTTRPRRDSTSSLAAAMQVKAQKDSIGSTVPQPVTPTTKEATKKPIVRMDRNKETENEVKKLVNSPPKQASGVPAKPPGSSEDNSSSDTEKKKPGRKPGPQPGMKKKEAIEEPLEVAKEPSATPDTEDFQHLADDVDVVVGDRIRVFYKFDNIYEAKVKKVQKPREGSKWPKFYIHYQGWNSRHDEWIKRSRIKENLSWSKDRVVDQAEQLEQVDEPVVPERKKPGPKVGRTPSKKSLAENPSSGSGSSKPEKSSRAGTPSSVTSKGSRTGSPALKRQSSRTSQKKGDSDSEEEDSESGTSRKSSRILKTTSVPVPSPSSTSSSENRVGRGRKRVKEESENEEVEVEKDEIKIEASEDISPVKKRGRKPKVEESESESSKSEASSTRSRGTPTRDKKPLASGRGTRGRGRGQKEEDDEDPYAFKEPENVEKENKVATTSTVTSTSTRRSRIDDKSSSEASLPEAKKLKIESDSTDSSSSDQETVKSKTRSTRSKKPQTSSEEEEKVSSEELSASTDVTASSQKTDLKNDNLQESKIQFTKKQQEIFPNLASKMASNTTTSKPLTTAIQAPPSVSSLSSEASDEVKSDEIISTKSDEQLLEKEHESQPHQQPPPVEAAATSVKKQRKTPSKPKSDELIDSESSDSEDQEEKPKRAVMTSEAKKSAAKKKSTESDDTEDEPLIKSNSRRGSQIDAKAASQVALATLASAASKKSKTKTEEPDDLDLACGETIPGSPVHPSSASTSMDVSPTSEAVAKPKIAPASSNTTRLEMPFASVPESVQGPQVASATSNIPATLPPASASETPDTASTPSRMSPSNAPAHEDGSKSPGGDSSEVDMDSKADSLDIEGSSSGEAKGRGTKRKAPNEVGSRSPAPSRRKRRTRESSRGRGGGRGRHGSGRRDHDDTDESEEAKDSTFAGIGSLDNDALAALAQDRTSTKYNFYPDFDNSMDSNTRIAMIQQNIKNLKKTYSSIKSKLSTTERQLKKIRRKEREKSDTNVTSNSTEPPVTSASENNAKTAIEASA